MNHDLKWSKTSLILSLIRRLDETNAFKKITNRQIENQCEKRKVKLIKKNYKQKNRQPIKVWIEEPLRKVERQVKVLITNLAIFFLFPSKKYLPISFKIQLLVTFPQKQKEQRQKKQLDVSFFWCLFPSCTFWILSHLLLLFTFCHVCLLVKETAEIETGMAKESSWD